MSALPPIAAPANPLCECFGCRDAVSRDTLMAAFSKIALHMQNTDTPSTHRSPR